MLSGQEEVKSDEGGEGRAKNKKASLGGEIGVLKGREGAETDFHVFIYSFSLAVPGHDSYVQSMFHVDRRESR